MINILNSLIGEVDNIQEQVGNVSREMETPRKNQKEILEIKKHCNGNKECFDALISRLDTAER